MSEATGNDVDDRGDDAGPEEPPKFDPLHPREWRRYTRYHFLLAKYLFIAGIAVLVFWALSTIGNVLFPVVVSLVVAYLLDPLIDWFEERGINRTLGIVFVLLAGLTSVVLFLLFLYPTIVEQVRTVIEQVPKLIDTIQTKTIPWIEETFDYEIPATVSEGVAKYGESLGEYIPTAAQRIGAWAKEIVTGTGAVVAWLLNLIMIPIFSFYFLRDFDHIRLNVIELIPEHRRNVVLDRLGEMDSVIGDWVRGQLQVASMLAILYAFGLSIAFQMAGIAVNSGIAIGILAGLLNFIPYFGVIVGIILSVLMVIINWSGFGPLIAVALVFVIVQTLEGYLITPKVVGEKVGLSPVTVIIVLLVGGELYGLTGVLIAIPIFGALKVLFPDLLRYYRNTPFFTGRKLVPTSAMESESPEREPPEEADDGDDDGGRGEGEPVADGGSGEADEEDEVAEEGESGEASERAEPAEESPDGESDEASSGD